MIHEFGNNKSKRLQMIDKMIVDDLRQMDGRLFNNSNRGLKTSSKSNQIRFEVMLFSQITQYV